MINLRVICFMDIFYEKRMSLLRCWVSNYLKVLVTDLIREGLSF